MPSLFFKKWKTLHFPNCCAVLHVILLDLYHSPQWTLVTISGHTEVKATQNCYVC